jgi:hypothetical protein
MGKRMGTGPVVSISPKASPPYKRPQFATVGQAAWEFGCGAASPSPGFHPVHLSPFKKVQGHAVFCPNEAVGGAH